MAPGEPSVIKPRPQTAPVRRRHKLTGEEQRIEEAFELYNNKMEGAARRLQERKATHSHKCSGVDTNRQRVLENRNEQLQSREYSDLNSVYLSDCKIKKQVKRATIEAHETLLYKSQLQREKYSSVQAKKSELLGRQKKWRGDIEKVLVKKTVGVEQMQEYMTEITEQRKELREIKHLEVAENLAIDKKLMFLEKKRLVEKQEAIIANYQDLRQKQSKMKEMMHQSEHTRQEMQRDRLEQVKFIKNNYLN